MKRQYDGSEIAIIGMACRFPGAQSVEEFWRNLCEGIESLTLLSDEDLRRAGVPPAVYHDPDFVRRASVVEDVEYFDAEFFGYTPAEARLIDPQQRLFMECAWQALERAGYDPKRHEGPIGVFTGAKTNTYLFNIVGNREVMAAMDNFRIAVGNDLASMATQVSFRFDLTGPSYALHTACSTSLVAVHLACQSLLLDECRLALAGGAAVNVPQRRGYLYQPGGLLSPDGSCRSFSTDANGTAFGNGAGVVVLKRLEDALADRDPIHAVLLGTATNNDGAKKASYTAPGVDGQTDVILEALACAGVEAQSLSFLETHGTGTPLGDSIEILALKQAFGATTSEQGFCALGAVKSNIGHLETAAGIAGLIKTAMALKHRMLPASLHCEQPAAELEGSPFYVNTKLRPWSEDRSPRRAGLSSFGIGSTNVHAILEEPPALEEGTPSRPWQLLLLSARSTAALDQATANLVAHLREGREADQDEAAHLADTAYTLQVGRRSFAHRRAVVCRDLDDAVAALESLDPKRVLTATGESADPPVAFLLPGLGDQAVGMARELYRTETTFREQLDRCAELLEPELGLDLRTVIYPPETEGPKAEQGPDLRRLLGRGGAMSDAERRLARTEVAQPAMFAVEYALAQLWMEWGVRPRAMIGYSLGEYVAACLAGVLSLEDALALVARRARMIGELPEGAMLGVSLPASELEAVIAELDSELSLAASNGPSLSVAAGDPEALAELERVLTEREVACRRLATTHAFHSRSLDPIADEVTAVVRDLRLQAPTIPYLSNLTGTWITPEEATDPTYWARHMCQPVRFEEGVRDLLADERRVLLELGSGQSLTSFVKVHPACKPERTVVTALPGTYERRDDAAFALTALGRLWQAGVEIDWSGFYARERRRRLVLPTYPFERKYFWIDPDTITESLAAESEVRVTLDKQEDLGDWLYRPVWEPAPRPEAAPTDDGCWLVLGDAEGPSRALAEALRQSGREVVEAAWAEGFHAAGDGSYTLAPDRPEDYVALFETLRAQGRTIRHVAHLAGLSPAAPDADAFTLSWSRGFLSLLYLAQAVGRLGLVDPGRPLAVTVATTGSFRVTGEEALRPESALVVGPCKVIPQEFPGLTCRHLDLLPRDSEAEVTALLVDELTCGDGEELVAYRRGERLIRRFERLPAAESEEPPPLREGGAYLLTGGLGGLGLALAEHLAQRYQARLVLTGRSPLPQPESWTAWLEEHDDDDPTSVKLRKLRELEAAGAEVLALDADAADVDAMCRVRDLALERFGRIDGVVHLAGIPGGGVVQLKTPEMARAIVAPKVRGALALAEALREVKLDFVILYSSIASILGEFGQIDYCGANAFLDVFASHWRGQGGPRVTTINWDIWREVGLAVYTEVPDHLRAWRREMLEKGMTSAEGVEVFERILARGEPQVIVSTQDLDGRIELGKSFTGERFLEQFRGHDQAPTTTAAAPVPVALTSGSEIERAITGVWQRILGREELRPDDNFFDLGGNSLLGLQLVNDMNRELGTRLSSVDLFEHPSIGALVRHLRPEEDAAAAAPAAVAAAGDDMVAIVGMAGRFPQAPNIDALWCNLRDGKDSFTHFSEEELLEAGIDPALVNDPNYVRVGAILEDVDKFDAGLFGYSPREAEIMDPQHRFFLECAWEALESAGYDSLRYPGTIGVYGGSSINTYIFRFQPGSEAAATVEPLQLIIGNDKDSLTTSVSYKLDLRGPSVGVQTFCSTSLVAVHMAVRSLLGGECTMALAGGVTVSLPQKTGYRFQEGSILAPDGRCRPFDADALGIVSGSGVGIVVLKRLSDAIADGDTIHAVIRGSAINNDGSVKAGYTAPSVGAQAEVVAAALRAAGVSAETIDYVEAHGTGTPLGDPIEVTALTRAFRETTEARGYCALGSVKGNVGHIDRAAGVTGLIKTVLALKNRQIPPSLHFERPNPKIDFAASPFFVNAQLRDWPEQDRPRRAGVSSLGFGGTNAHVVLEEAPELDPSDPARGPQLLVFSGRTATARDAVAGRLADFLEACPDLNLGDVAFTLQQGRRELEHRRAVVVGDSADAAEVLRSAAPERTWNGVHKPAQRQCVFLFPGQGSQYPGMGAELYAHDAVFRSELDRCCEILEPILGIDMREVIGLGSETNGRTRRSAPTAATTATAATTDLGQTAMTQPALFAIEYALARMWMAWGIKPEIMIGHSIGEYVAACLAGVFSLEDALALVAERGRLIQELPGGDMLGVPLSEDELLPRLEGSVLSLAAVNAPDRLVVSGTAEAVDRFAEALQADGIDGRRLHTSHAFHSAMLEPAVEPFARRVAEVGRKAPAIPFYSCLTGTRITAEEAVDPAYWAAQLRQGVRFSAGVTEILKDPSRVLLEVGPGSTLTTLTRRHLERGSERTVVASLPSPKEKRSAHETALTALGRLWLAGLSPDWSAVHGDARRRRIPLPTYPFERQRYWVEEATTRVGQGALTAGRRPQEWLFSPGWKTSRPPRSKPPESARHELGWLILSDGSDLAATLAKRVQKRGWPVTVARRGDAFADCGHGVYTVRPEERDYDALLEEIRDTPPVVLTLRSMDAEAIETEGLDDLLRLARSLGHRRGSGRTALWVLTNGLHEALAQEGPTVARSSLLAACRAINRGYPNLVCRHLDLFLGPDHGSLGRLPDQILAEVVSEPPELTIAYWRNRRWVPVMEAVAPGEAVVQEEPETLPEGNYLVTGGLEEPGFSLAASLSTGAVRRLILLEPTELPPREQWEEIAEERAPSAEELNAFLATLAAENGIDLDMAERGAEFPERMERLADEVEREELPQGFDALSDALCAAHAYRFFAGQVEVGKGKSYPRDELRRTMAVVPQFERFFHYLLHVLARAGMVELNRETNTVTFQEVPAGATDAEALGQLAAEHYPAFRPGIDCIAHCAAHYPEAFRGAVDPVSILYPDGSPEMLRQVMETQDRYSINRIFYPLMVEQIREAAAELTHRPLRILEFGAGDGNLTWELAEALRDSNVEYHFTDIGRAFVVAGRKAAEERGLDFMRFGVLDITRDPEEQGYERYSFDVLVTFDVVHATPRIRETMLNLKRLLAPGGWTMLLEPTRDQHWISMIWGLAEGWWLFADEEIRTLHPLLEPRQWARVLSDLGFAHCEVYPLDPVERALVDHSLLVVQQPFDLRTGEYLEMAVARWQERRRRIAERTRRVRALESQGTDVVLLRGDLENADEVAASIAPLRERWGPLAGVVHAAGPWNGMGERGDELDPAVYPRTLARTAAAIRALEAAVATDGCELALLVSPLAAAGDEVPGPENAVDLYLAAYASRDGAAAISWRSLAWGVPVTGASRGEGLSSHLGATALAGFIDCPELSRVLVTHRPPAAMAGAWNRLPDPRAAGAAAGGGTGDGYVAPATEQEKTVAGIWQEVLGIDRVGLHDNFFELGGDSLIATQIHSRIRETFKIKMPVEKLFELPTLEAQARAVAEIQAEKDQRQHEEIMAVLAELSDEEAEQALLELT